MVRLTDHFNMIIAVDWDIKPQAKKNQSCKICVIAKVSCSLVRIFIICFFDKYFVNQRPGPEVIKLFFVLNSAEHEFYPAH